MRGTSMFQPKLLSVFGALSIALFFGAGSSKADVITFSGLSGAN